MGKALEQNKPENEIQWLNIDKIDLDSSNPRFGKGDFNGDTSQPEVLNFIVEHFGVDDVLSSLAVNGFFAAEPIVCRRKDDRYIVLEGNRRLAAMLILSGDERAKAHQTRITKYQQLYQDHGEPSFDPVPAIVYEMTDDDRKLVSYLGVRHIVSTRDWDSFAKAHWVYTTVKDSKLKVDDVATMTGDSHQTIKKLLQGYNFIRQLEEANLFIPEHSSKGGRGSNTKYPFSWVYTALGYKQVKDFVDLSDDATNEKPIPESKLENASIIVEAMFGNSSKGKNSQVGDSRNLSQLASALSTPEKIRYLKQGKHVSDIDDLTKPAEERVEEIFFTIRDFLAEANDRLIREGDDIESFKLKNLKNFLDNQLKKQFKVLDKGLEEKISAIKDGDDW